MLARLFGAALAAVLIAALPVVSPPAAADVSKQRVIVQVDGADPARVADDVAAKHGGRVRNVFRHAVSGFAMELPAPAVAALQADPRIAAVELDLPMRVQAEVPTGVARSAVASNTEADIDGQDDARVDVDIAVVDTGIDSTHPDLNVRGGVDCTTGTCLTVPVPIDDSDVGHGTHVAGTAAAIDNGSGVVGTAPGARLWSVKVLRMDGSGSGASVLAGLDWVAENAGTIEIANVSLGCDSAEGSCASEILDGAVSALADAGVVVVAATGNAAEDIDGFAITGHPDAITVSAMADLDGAPGALAGGTCFGHTDDTFAWFSSYGEAVDLAAPGVCIRSTVPFALGSYGGMSGTSMAAPHVAGAAGLYIAQHGVAKGPDRAATVRQGLAADWSVAQTSRCGFTGGVTDEPMLYLTDCALDQDTLSSPGGTSTEPPPSLGRLAGDDRIATSVAISEQVYADGASAAVVAYGGDFPDALAAAPLASAAGGPVLLNVRDRLHEDVGAELDRLGAKTVYVLGGTTVQTAQVERDLRDRAMHPVRVAGNDRWSTAAAAADRAVQVWQSTGGSVSSNAVLALGTDFPDALSGGVLAGTRRSALLLTGRDALPSATSDALRDLGAASVTVMGGTAAVSDSVVSQLESQGYAVMRIDGRDRFETAVQAADAAVRAGAEYRSVLIASGRSFADALAGGPAVVSRDGVLLLSERDDLPSPSSQALSTAEHVNWVRLAGGAAVLTDAVLGEASAASGIAG